LGSSPLKLTKNKFSTLEEYFSKFTLLLITSDALPFDVKETAFEIRGLHKAALLRAAFYKAFPNFKS
jgi:hypothetical protein